MFVLTAVLSALLAAIVTLSAFRKFSRATDSFALRDRLSVPPRVWSAVAVAEALAGIGIVAGLRWAALGVAASVGVVFLMAGAVALHLRARLLGVALVSPIGVLVLAVVVATLRASTA